MLNDSLTTQKCSKTKLSLGISTAAKTECFLTHKANIAIFATAHSIIQRWHCKCMKLLMRLLGEYFVALKPHLINDCLHYCETVLLVLLENLDVPH